MFRGWSDEAMKQLVLETRTPIPAQSQQPERFDYHISMSVMERLIYSWSVIRLKDGEPLKLT